MKRFYTFGVFGISFIFLFGWMLNCSGVSGSSTNQYLPNLNANEVISSDWIDANQWVSTSVFGLPARACELNNRSNLANSVLDDNQLYVYSKIEDEVRPMPFNMNVGNAELRFDYTLSQTSTLRIVMIGLKGSLNPISNQQYRYVLIPNSLAKKSSINMGDYEAVKAAFRLRD